MKMDDVTEEGGICGRCGLLGAESEREGGRAPVGRGTRMRGEGAEPGRGCAPCSE